MVECVEWRDREVKVRKATAVLIDFFLLLGQTQTGIERESEKERARVE